MATHKNKRRNLYSYNQYKNWPDDERWELIDGEAYNMSPAPGLKHQAVSLEISRQIANYLIGKSCNVFAAPFDVFLPGSNESEDQTSTIVQPDITIVCDSSKLTDKGCIGSPDIIIEIISPASASKDQIIKLGLYERHNVKEYWIVHPVDRIIWKYIFKNGKYSRPFIYDKTDKPSFEKFPKLKIDLLKVFGVENDDFVQEPSPETYK